MSKLSQKMKNVSIYKIHPEQYNITLYLYIQGNGKSLYTDFKFM